MTLKTNRSLFKFLVFGFLTLGIYNLIRMTEISMTVNILCGQADGKKTMNYLWLLLWGPLSFGIVWIVWQHNISKRIGMQLVRWGQPREVSAATFWIWDIAGTLIIVGPFVYTYKLFKGMNILCEEYNERYQLN